MVVLSWYFEYLEALGLGKIRLLGQFLLWVSNVVQGKKASDQLL